MANRQIEGHRDCVTPLVISVAYYQQVPIQSSQDKN